MKSIMCIIYKVGWEKKGRVFTIDRQFTATSRFSALYTLSKR